MMGFRSLQGFKIASNDGHSYWRLDWDASAIPTRFYAVFGEIQMRSTPGGVDQCTGGTASAFSEYPPVGSVTFYAANAFDNNQGTGWTPSSPGSAGWIEYAFPSPVPVAELFLQFVTDSTNFPLSNSAMPSSVRVQYSDDGVAWTTQKTISIPQTYTYGTSYVIAAV